MVKGISRQVIVVNSPEPKLFEQAIFILRSDMGEGVTDDALMKEARQLLKQGNGKTGKPSMYGPFWAAGGALLTGLVWAITMLF